MLTARANQITNCPSEQTSHNVKTVLIPNNVFPNAQSNALSNNLQADCQPNKVSNEESHNKNAIYFSNNQHALNQPDNEYPDRQSHPQSNNVAHASAAMEERLHQGGRELLRELR